MSETRKPRFSLRSKMTLIFLIPLLVMGLILTTCFALVSTTVQTNRYTDQATSLARSFANSVKEKVSALSQQFDAVIKNPDIVNESIPLDTRKQSLNASAEISTFKDFAVSYSDGKTYNDTDISGRDYFKNAMESKDAYVSSPVIRMTDNSLTIMMGKYFSANGQDYLCYGGLDAEIFTNIIKDVHFGENGVCFIMDKDMQVIASSTDAIPVLTDLSPESDLGRELSGLKKLADNMTSKNTDSTVARFNGEDYFFGYTPVEGAEGWTLAVGTPKTLMVTTIVLSGLVFIALTVVVIVIAIGVSSTNIKHVCQRVEKTSERLAAFAGGDISTPAPKFTSGDEIEIMGDSLGEMVSSIGEYISDIKNVLNHLAEGDLTVKPNAAYNGEFFEIKTALENIISSLRSVIDEVGESALQVRTGASQLADGASQLSQNSITQAATVDQITATVREISEKTALNTGNVKKALATSQNTNEQAKDGSRSMDEMLMAFREIESSSNEIGQIIKVIDDIAFQTNILALNAAIEAARAGEAGKGFAVVADEVGNLAGKSAEAAKQTGQLINKSIDAVNRGAALADAASSALNGIVKGVEDVSGVMNEIAAANDEQTAAVGQISDSISTVNSAIHNTSSTAEESAAASQELSAQAVALSDAVAKFKLN